MASRQVIFMPPPPPSSKKGIIVLILIIILAGVGVAIYYGTKNKPIPTAITCIGVWSNTGTCSNSLQTQTYSITTEASNGGAACSNTAGDTKNISCTTTYKTPPTGFSLCRKDGLTTTASDAYAILTTLTAAQCEANCSSNTSCTAYEADNLSNCLLYGTTQQVTPYSTSGAKNICHLKNT